LFALFASANISATLTEIVSRSMPATIESFRLSEDTDRLTASAPRLMAAENEGARAPIAAEIAAQSRKLQSRIQRLRALDADENDALVAARSAIG
jgi:sensor TorS-like protein